VQDNSGRFNVKKEDGSMYRSDAISQMKKYFKDNRFVEHTLKVLSRAEKIFLGEGLEDDFIWNTVTLGSVFHDIGIVEALRKHDSLEAPYQEQEGPAVARRIMEDIGVRPDILERVCFMVGNHHTREAVDGMDFQILWEADFIVNIEEKNILLDPDKIEQNVAENIRTQTGGRLVREVLP
jgi:HD superfamily phosphodiesterase